MSNDRTPKNVIEVADGFWNIRGSFKLGGIVDIGTQASLVRRASGRYVLLDAVSLSDATRAWIDEMTTGGADIEAVIHLHPFHTVFVRGLHAAYPRAKLYGTARHLAKLDDLPWEPVRSEDPELGLIFGDDLEFSVPLGVDFVPSNENLHFASVLVFHRGSKTLHVDDTLAYVRLPKLFLNKELVMFHPALAKVLEPRAGAAAAFRGWAQELIERSRDIGNLCAAHSATLLERENRGPSISARIENAFSKVDGKLKAHERKYG